MIKEIQAAYEKGQVVLFLGAGCSLSSKDSEGEYLLSSPDLEKCLAKYVGWNYNGESLSAVYSAVKREVGESLYELLMKKFKHCTPSLEYINLAKYVWPRIYTTNIDDAFERALLIHSKQNINVRQRNNKISDQDQSFKNLDYVKLNGDISRPDFGFVFSPVEYGEAASLQPLWYKELAEDFYKYTFVFIGTKLNEPLFYHQVCRFRSEVDVTDRTGYVITPSATIIEKGNLEELGLKHIKGTLLDFVNWLDGTGSHNLSTINIALNRRPEMRALYAGISHDEKLNYASLFDDLYQIDRSLHVVKDEMPRIRSFYKGFKPDWVDIYDAVPAVLNDSDIFYQLVKEEINSVSNLVILYGQAGSGKSTLLKQTACRLHDDIGVRCFFIERPTSDFIGLIRELEKMHNDRFCIFLDRLDAHVLDIKEVIDSRIISKGLLICSESQRKWNGEIEYVLKDYYARAMKISNINKKDAKAILDKVEKYGPWTRLRSMTESQRISELLEKSKRQLLIGLLEATYGVGFEKIIENDFKSLTDEKERFFVILVGLATLHKYSIKRSFVSKALFFHTGMNDIDFFIKKLSGIISIDKENLSARHHIYVRYLFDAVVNFKEIFEALKALIFSYTAYGVPISKNVGRNDNQLFKALINHKFLKDIFKSHKDCVLGIYESFEKTFEHDGHFMLQYGLALRDFDMHNDAYEKLQVALIAFPNSSLIDHAIAQQELIISCRLDSYDKAYNLLQSAIERLEKLDTFYESRSDYPIVTLSEGHVSVFRRFKTEDEAKKLAKNYANRISRRTNFKDNKRLFSSWNKLVNFSFNGTWIDEKQNGAQGLTFINSEPDFQGF
jgi:energy-coupling factor transporter ATP-binding protein EcfA2